MPVLILASTGQSPSSQTDNVNGQGLPFFQGKTEFSDVYPTVAKWCSEPKKIALPEDILISVRAPVGPTNLAKEECCIGRGLAAIRAKADIIDRDYLWYFLQASESKLVGKGQGSTFEAINSDDLNSLRIPFVKPEDQRRIAAQLKAQLAEVEKTRKAAEMQLHDVQLLETRTLEAFFSELDTAPKVKIGDVAQTTSGSTPARGQKGYWEPAEIPWVKTAEVAFAPIEITRESVSKKALQECSLTLLPPKTVLVAMYGQGKTRGQSAILDVAATTNQACFAIFPNETWEPDFLYLWLKRSYSDLRALSEDRGGNQANLNGALLKAFEVPSPEKSVQKRIIEKARLGLDQISFLREGCNGTLIDIQQIPSRLLAKVFEQN